HLAEYHISPDIPCPVLPQVQEIKTSRISAVMKDGLKAHFPVHSSEYSTEHCLPFFDILLQSAYEIIGKGLHYFLTPVAYIIDDIAAFNEEGSLLIEEILEAIDTHLRGVCLHLSKVGIDREVEDQITCHCYLTIHTGRYLRFFALGERIAFLLLILLCLCRHI